MYVTIEGKKYIHILLMSSTKTMRDCDTLLTPSTSYA